MATIVITDHPDSMSVDSFDIVFLYLVCGSQTTEKYSTVDLTRAKYATSLQRFGKYLRLCFKKFSVLLAFLVVVVAPSLLPCVVIVVAY